MEQLCGWLKYRIKMTSEVIKHTKSGMGDASRLPKSLPMRTFNRPWRSACRSLWKDIQTMWNDFCSL